MGSNIKEKNYIIKNINNVDKQTQLDIVKLIVVHSSGAILKHISENSNIDINFNLVPANVIADVVKLIEKNLLIIDN